MRHATIKHNTTSHNHTTSLRTYYTEENYATTAKRRKLTRLTSCLTSDEASRGQLTVHELLLLKVLKRRKWPPLVYDIKVSSMSHYRPYSVLYINRQTNCRNVRQRDEAHTTTADLPFLHIADEKVND